MMSHALLSAIAKKHLGIETLDDRHSDRLDFHDVAVWDIKDALRCAFLSGAALSLTEDERLGILSELRQLSPNSIAQDSIVFNPSIKG